MNSIQEYSGRYPKISDKRQYACYMANVNVSEKIYPKGTCDWDLKDRQVLLNEETAEYLYQSYTPLQVYYRLGSRPILERIVQKICKPSMTEREKVFAILQYAYTGFRDDFKKPEGLLCMLNASEEELIKLGGGQCEDRSRLIICLAQIAGFPSRAVASYGRLDDNGQVYGGHAILEIFLEGGWAFFDSLRNFYCIKKDNKIASLWDLASDPNIVQSQDDSTYNTFVVPRKTQNKEKYLKYYDQYLDQKNIVAISNYSVNDYSKYDWKWVELTTEIDDKSATQKKEYVQEYLNET